MKFVDLIIYRSAAELKAEGTRTYAGYLWWIIEPLLSLAVYYVAFKYILHRGTENFALFLFSGIVVYRFFSGTVTRSATSIMDCHGLMQLVYVHKSIFPLSVVMVNLVKFLFSLLLVMAAIWLSGIHPTMAYALIPILILFELLLTAGISMICAAITPFFPDFQLILATLINLLIFLSGVFYDVNSLSPHIQSLMRLNPLVPIIEQYRVILLQGQYPNLYLLLPGLVESLIFLMIGWLAIHKNNRYYPKIS